MIFQKKQPPFCWPTFLTRRMEIRPYRRQDAAAVWQVLRSPQIYATTAYIPKDIQGNQVFSWIEHIHQSADRRTGFEFGMFSRRNGIYLGNVGLINLNFHNRSGEITYFVHPDFWGQGYATEGAAEMLRYGFSQWNLYRMAGTCMSHNTASQRVMEKLGFRVEGIARGELCKDGKFVDITHLSLLRPEWNALQS